jgi:hypothetical protein
MQYFDPALVRVGSKRELAFFGIMSATAGCGHNVKSGFVSLVHTTSCEQLQQRGPGETRPA